jgi:bifunctional non-homologous end joining protein LigD
MKVETSSEDKIYFPDDGITKGDVLEYYQNIADHMLPHLADRPLMLQRFPEGIDESGFYQKEAGEYFPDWIETVEVEKEDGKLHHVICSNASTLKYLVNQGTLTFHTWLSRKPKIDYPDKFIIDLDPPEGNFAIVRKAARILRDFFEEVEIRVFMMTTGSQGLHIMMPLDGKSDFDTVKEVGKKLGNKMVDEHPDIFTRAQRKDKREGKLFFDIERNAYAQTAVAPYTIRPIKGAPVATPLSWDELDKSDLNSHSYKLKNIRRRLSQKEDPWKGYGRHKVGIKRLDEKI